MEAICSSETSVDTQRTTLRYIPEDGTLHNHRCENLKSDIIFPCSFLSWYSLRHPIRFFCIITNINGTNNAFIYIALSSN
jgi:hypothetical protein